MRKLRNKLRIEALSRMAPERRAAVLPELERMAADNGVEPPARSWVGPNKETLVAILDGAVVGSVTVQNVPMIEPLLWNADSTTSTRAALVESLLRRAEGFAQALGHDEAFAILTEDSPQAFVDAITHGGEAEQRGILLVCREL